MSEPNVPLICDPVPGPVQIITLNHGPLSLRDAQRLRRQWDELCRRVPPRVAFIEGYRHEPLVGQRTEWPDAEFCAA